MDRHDATQNTHTGALEQARKDQTVFKGATSIDHKIQKRLETKQGRAAPAAAASKGAAGPRGRKVRLVLE